MLADQLAKPAYQPPAQLRLLREESIENLPRLHRLQPVGLTLWTLEHAADLPAVCSSLRSISALNQASLRVCFADAVSPKRVSILLEAGAQIVVSQLPSLYKALPRIIQNANFTSRGTHPLTTGLIERLPWSNPQAHRK
jgi:hypothetical protein